MAECGIILSGGFATRLRPLSYTKPKPLFPVLGKPVLDWVIENMLEITEPVVSAGYLSNLVRNHINAKWFNRVKIVEEDRPLGDGGAVANVVRQLGLNGPLVVANGDVFTDMSIREVWNFHKKTNAAVTIGLIEVSREEANRFGIVTLDDGGRVVQFVEKPKEPVGTLANAGFYIFEPEAVAQFPEPTSEVKIAKHILPKLLHKFDVYGYVHGGIWFDIGTHADYLRANFAALEKCSACRVERSGVIPPVYIDPTAVIEHGSLVGPYAVIGAGARIGPYSRIKESIFMDGVIAEAGTYVTHSIVGEGVVLGKWSRLVEAVVADGVYVRDGVYIARGATVGPNREVESDVREGEILP